VLGSDGGADTVDASERNRACEVATAHVVGLGRGVDDVVNGLEGEVESHELDDWAESVEASANTDTSETGFSNWSVPDSLASVLVKHSFGDLVCSVVLCDLLTHEEHALVSLNFVTHGGINRISNGHFFIK